SARTGSSASVDLLVVPGSQAAGNASILADLSRQNHYNFISSRIDFDPQSWQINVLVNTATATVTYSLYGHLADWPSLRPRDSDHQSPGVLLNLQLELHGDQW